MFRKKDYILHQRGVMCEEECNKFINFFEKNKDYHHKRLEGEGGKYVKDTEIFMEFSNRDVFAHIVGNTLSLGIEEYKKQYFFVDAGVNTWITDNVFKIQKYNPNEGYFALHCENAGVPEFLKRILAWTIYLNDVKDGGYTEFPVQNRRIQPRRGDVVIFPAYFTHPHRGITSKTEPKYILTGWYSYCDDGQL